MFRRVLALLVITSAVSISAGAAYHFRHTPLKPVAKDCCGDPLCPPPPIPCNVP